MHQILYFIYDFMQNFELNSSKKVKNNDVILKICKLSTTHQNTLIIISKNKLFSCNFIFVFYFLPHFHFKR